jgi:Icc-related predicted phosphoesterase
MRILAISDVVVPQLYAAEVPERFRQVDLVLSCGDLPYDYLEYVVTRLGKPLYYVHGNHAPGGPGIFCDDGAFKPGPDGCSNLHRRIVNFRGLRIGGLEGCVRYNPGPFQYSQSEMQRFALGMTPGLMWNRHRYGRGLDILLTHASPWGIHDQPDAAHRGFKAYLSLMERFRPRYLIHGHVHLYRGEVQRTLYHETTVINAYGFQFIDVDVASDGKTAADGQKGSG